MSSMAPAVSVVVSLWQGTRIEVASAEGCAAPPGSAAGARLPACRTATSADVIMVGHGVEDVRAAFPAAPGDVGAAKPAERHCHAAAVGWRRWSAMA